MTTIYLSLGANLGNREQTINKALQRLAETPGIKLLTCSAFYETAPWGKTDQPPFINAAVKISTELTMNDLLTKTQQIETELGRERHEHWGARTIDIDLLFSPDQNIRTPELTLPHPYIKERNFVLIPLQEIAPTELLDGRTVTEWLAVCPDKGKVDKKEVQCLK